MRPLTRLEGGPAALSVLEHLAGPARGQPRRPGVLVAARLVDQGRHAPRPGPPVPGRPRPRRAGSPPPAGQARCRGFRGPARTPSPRRRGGSPAPRAHRRSGRTCARSCGCGRGPAGSAARSPGRGGDSARPSGRGPRARRTRGRDEFATAPAASQLGVVRSRRPGAATPAARAVLETGVAQGGGQVPPTGGVARVERLGDPQPLQRRHRDREVLQGKPAHLARRSEHRRPRAGRAARRARVQDDCEPAAATGRHLDDVAWTQRLQRCCGLRAAGRRRRRAPTSPPGPRWPAAARRTPRSRRGGRSSPRGSPRAPPRCVSLGG